MLVNLTPHDIVIIKDGLEFVRIAPSGKVARVEEWDAPVHDEGIADAILQSVPVVRKRYGHIQIINREDFLIKNPFSNVEPMPEPQPGIDYIVPMLVGVQLTGKRDDIYGADFGIGGTRTADGKITGAVGFIKY